MMLPRMMGTTLDAFKARREVSNVSGLHGPPRWATRSSAVSSPEAITDLLSVKSSNPNLTRPALDLDLPPAVENLDVIACSNNCCDLRQGDVVAFLCVVQLAI